MALLPLSQERATLFSMESEEFCDMVVLGQLSSFVGSGVCIPCTISLKISQ